MTRRVGEPRDAIGPSRPLAQSPTPRLDARFPMAAVGSRVKDCGSAVAGYVGSERVRVADDVQDEGITSKFQKPISCDDR